MADALEKACYEDPLRCPSVLDLVTATPSKLPAWMVNSPAVTVQQATREVKPGQAPPPPVSNSVPLSGSNAGYSQHWQTVTPAGVYVPSQPPPAKGAPAVQVPPREVARHIVTYAFLGIFLIWLWIPLLRMPFVGFGASSQAATWLSVLTYLVVCAMLAYRRAKKEANPTAFSSQPASWTPTPPVSTTSAAPRSAPTYRSQPQTNRVSTSRASTAPTALVGSKIRLIYHKPTCKWATKISYRNRIQFSSEADAKGRGYRPCSVCSP